VAFIDQCKHWSIPLFLFASHASEKKCTQIPPSAPRKQLDFIIKLSCFCFILLCFPSKCYKAFLRFPFFPLIAPETAKGAVSKVKPEKREK